LLTFLEAGPSQKFAYHTIEKFPLAWEQVEALGYQKHLELNSEQTDLFRSMHKEGWGGEQIITGHFKLIKEKVSLQDFHPEKGFDLVYFDAFAPEIQPEMWTGEIFRRLYEAMNPGALLVTYSAKGEVRRNMLKAGFHVERLPGPPGKREMLRAGKL